MNWESFKNFTNRCLDNGKTFCRKTGNTVGKASDAVGKAARKKPVTTGAITILAGGTALGAACAKLFGKKSDDKPSPTPKKKAKKEEEKDDED